MPDNKPDEALVTQADREAAADLIWPEARDGSIPAIEAWHRVQKGDDDGHRFVQAFARHRTSAYEAGRMAMQEEAARVADIYAKAASNQRMLATIDGNDGDGEWYWAGRHKGGLDLATAIRSLTVSQKGEGRRG